MLTLTYFGGSTTGPAVNRSEGQVDEYRNVMVGVGGTENPGDHRRDQRGGWPSLAPLHVVNNC